MKRHPDVRSEAACEAFRSSGGACALSTPNFAADWKATATPSFCHVWKRLWLGNIDSGLGVAIEAGVRFDSLADEATGVALADSPFVRVDKDEFDRRLARAAAESPPFFGIVDGKPRPMRVPPANTEVAFAHFMRSAAVKIARLLSVDSDNRLLVFCVGGINRSASAIVSYLVLEERLEAIDAVAVVRDAARLGRNGATVLTNPDFVLFFLSGKLFAKSAAEAAAAFYAQFGSTTPAAVGASSDFEDDAPSLKDAIVEMLAASAEIARESRSDGQCRC